jgi:sigma-B regulation protein RsbU (phosphoserine phosphatase)
MLLRTRVIVIVLMALLAVGYVLVQAAYERERVVDRRFAEASEAGLAALWKEVRANLLAELSMDLDRFSYHPDIRTAVSRNDRRGLSDHIRADLSSGGALHAATHIDVVDTANQVLFTLSSAVSPQPAFGPSVVEQTTAASRPISGLRYDRDLGLLLLVGTTLRDSSERVVGAITVGFGVDQALKRMRDSMGSDLVIVSQDGRLLAGTAPELWQDIAGHGEIQLAEPIQTFDHEDGVHTLVRTALSGLDGNQTGWLISLRDTTATALAARRLTWISIGIALGLVGAILLGLFLYLRRSFMPLDRSIGVLDALARGDTSVGVQVAGREDEVGRIARTIEVFRAQTIALHRLERARDLQRRRQERVIRNQMQALAQTLDEAERVGVIGDLAEIEALGRKSADRTRPQGAAGDGLGLMAVALRKLASRVISQQNRLRQLIEELSEALKTKTAFLALQQELDIAARIQKSVLPRPMEPTERFEIAGLMIPAKEVGCDYYDFFMLGPDHLAMTVADVSGKGVAAAFFMAITRTLLHATTTLITDPTGTITRLNDILYADNDEGMFVTMFYGVMNLATGELAYVSAGHNPPLLGRASGEIVTLPQTGGVALGVVEGFTFNSGKVTLSAGDLLFMFTDGVTEASQVDGQLYGDDRLSKLFAGIHRERPAAVIDAIVADVRTFESGAAQADDITCVALHLRAGS